MRASILELHLYLILCINLVWFYVTLSGAMGNAEVE